MKFLRWIYDQMGRAPALVVFHAVPMAIAWYIGRHIIFWLFAAFWAIETGGPQHFGRPLHPESQIAAGEIWIAWMAAYLTGAWMMQSGWMWGAYSRIGRAENVSPTLLFLVTPKQDLGWAGLIFLPCSCVLFLPYAMVQVSLAITGILGGRALLARFLKGHYRVADVVDISPGSTYRLS